MLKRYQVTAIALALVCFSITGQAQEKAHDEQDQASQQAQTYPIPFPVRIIEDQAAAEARERREAESRQNEIDDLAAQQGMNAATQSMNDATQKMVGFAYLQTWFVGLGTALLVGTAVLGIQANRAAIATLHANRAWVLHDVYDTYYIDNSTYSETSDSTPIRFSKGVGFTFHWKNFGQSPAIKTKFVTKSKVTESETEIPRFIESVEDDNDAGYLPQGGVGTTPVRIIYDSDLDALKTNKKRLFIYSKVEYYDIFRPKKLRKSEFCAEIVYSGIVLDEKSGKPREHYSTRFVGNQNMCI